MEIFGFIMAISMMFFTSLKMVSMKHNLKDIDSNSLIFLLSGLVIITITPYIITQGIPELSPKFW